MKIAIKANPNRGKEIISLLESLGGINDRGWIGDGDVDTYCIDKNNIIRYCCAPTGYKVYTLEEFETQFPFKVGDKVIHKEFNDFFEVISFNPGSPYPYKIKGVCEFTTKSYVLTKWQPKMKEERFVTLTLDKAKEWYKKGGELKEIALQAFSERELNPLPRSWEEFCEKYPVKSGECILEAKDRIIVAPCNFAGNRVYKNWIPSKKSAESYLAMIQLEQLRDCWRQGNIPQEFKYKIKKVRNKYTVLYGEEDAFLSFCDKQTAEEFLKCFRDLIEKAGDLI